MPKAITLAPISEALREKILELGSEGRANEERNYRRSRYWLTGLAIKTRATKLREYLGKITEADVDFLRGDPNAAEAVEELRRLGKEAFVVAEALTPDEEEAKLLARARERVA